MKIEFKHEFGRLLQESILEGLESAIGESGTKAVLSNIELVQCTENPEEFHKALFEIFDAGAPIIERVIVKGLFRKLQVPFDDEGALDFAAKIDYARALFATRQRVIMNRSVKAKSLRDQVARPHLKIIKTVWQNSAVQSSFVVIDLDGGQEYPQNFVCVFPRNLFRKNQKGNLKRSRFYRIFGEKTYETAKRLLEDALNSETDLDTRRQIEASLKEVSQQSM